LRKDLIISGIVFYLLVMFFISHAYSYDYDTIYKIDTPAPAKTWRCLIDNLSEGDKLDIDIIADSAYPWTAAFGVVTPNGKDQTWGIFQGGPEIVALRPTYKRFMPLHNISIGPGKYYPGEYYIIFDYHPDWGISLPVKFLKLDLRLGDFFSTVWHVTYKKYRSDIKQIPSISPESKSIGVNRTAKPYPHQESAAPTIMDISSPKVNIFINTTTPPDNYNSFSSQTRIGSPPTYTREIKGYIKYIGGNVDRRGLDVRLRELFNGIYYDIGSSVSSRQDGSFRIRYTSDRLHNPDNPYLVIQAFRYGNPVTLPAENVGGMDSIELAC
jgi:hypothetical protein